MLHLLRVTALNLPGLTRAAGIVSVSLLGVINVWAAWQPATPGYVAGLLGVGAVGSFVAALGLVVGRRAAGWLLAVATSLLCLIAYLLSRAIGLPGFGAAVGAWHHPVGTVSLLLEAFVVGLYVSLRVGWNVDARGQRDWDTYFSRPCQGRTS